MFERIKGVLLLDWAAFKDVEHDPSANGQALIIVIVSSLLAAVSASSGPFVGALAAGRDPWVLGTGNDSVILAFLGTVLWSILAWFVWTATTYLIGTRVFSGRATYGEMLRVIGFAYAPISFMVFGAIPCVGFFISLIVTVWALAAVFVGVREGLDLDRWPTVISVVAGWILYAIGMALLGIVFNVI